MMPDLEPTRASQILGDMLIDLRRRGRTVTPDMHRALREEAIVQARHERDRRLLRCSQRPPG